MTPERLQQVKRLFHDALLLPASARSAWLTRACEGDMELRQEVETLLSAHEDTGRTLRPVRAGDSGIVRNASDLDRQMREALDHALRGRYEVIRLLGRGGMGDVYLARDIALDVRVAVKVLRPELAVSLESQHRFLREARVAARLRHPGIVRLHHYLHAGELWCFVMDFVPGGALDRRLKSEGALPCGEVREILIDLASALDYAHAHGVIHRDIKPGNILFDADRKPMLADFGIAKVGDAPTLTPPNETRGTPAYMSPEQLQGRSDVDGRSDIYSLGLVAYAMLVGCEPYGGLSVGETVARKLAEDPPPITQAARSVTAGLAKVITRCLSRDPGLRFENARALKEALEHADCDPAATLHPELEEMPGFGQWSLVWATFWTTYAIIGDHGLREIILTLVVAALVPIGFALQLWNLGRHPLAWLELFRVTYWPPVWWGMWWPAMLRRPTDLWARLPWQARGVRIALSIFFVGMPALIMAQSLTPSTSRRIAQAEYLLLAATGLVTVLGILWTRRRGVPSREMTRVLFGATSRPSAWRSATLARLLAPPRGVPAPANDDPADHVRAISEIARLLPRNMSGLGRESAALARRLLRVIGEFEREVATLQADADPSRIEAVRRQLEALGPASTQEPGNRRELRNAVAHQLTALEAMRHDAELSRHARDEVFDLIRSVWAHLRRVHEDSTTEGVEADGAADALRALHSEVETRLLLWMPDPDPTDDDEGGAAAPAGQRPTRPPPVLRLAQVQGSSPLGP